MKWMSYLDALIFCEHCSFQVPTELDGWFGTGKKGDRVKSHELDFLKVET